jgi:hypothetical protein
MGRQGWYPRATGAKPCGLEDQVEDLRLNSAEVYVRAGAAIPNLKLKFLEKWFL